MLIWLVGVDVGVAVMTPAQVTSGGCKRVKIVSVCVRGVAEMISVVEGRNPNPHSVQFELVCDNHTATVRVCLVCQSSVFMSQGIFCSWVCNSYVRARF